MPQYLRFQPLTADDRSHKARYKGGRKSLRFYARRFVSEQEKQAA